MSNRSVPKRPRDTAEANSIVRGHRILVVEDDLFFQEYVSDILIREGAEVLRAPDGEAALSQVSATRPSVVLIDLEIPKIHGFELLRIMRSRPETASIPLIMMSGKVDREVFDRHSQGRVRADGYLVKPFSPPELLSALRQAIHPEQKTGARKAAPATHVAAPAEIPAASRPPRILVVDDSAHIRSMVGDFLREAGAEVLEAADGKTGLARAIELKPDGVLLDVQMPHLNGFVVCELLKKDTATRSIPIIIMSAVADEETFRKHSRLKNRADAYLLKPFKKGDLFALLARLTGQRAFAAPRPLEKSGFVLPPAPERADEEHKGNLADKLARALKRIEELDAVRSMSEEEAQRVKRELETAGAARKEAEAEASRLKTALKGMEAERSAAQREAKRAEEAFRNREMELAKTSAAGRKSEEDKKETEGRLKKLEAEAAAARGAMEELEKVRKLAAREAGSRRDLEAQVTVLTAEREAALDEHSRVKSVSGKAAGKAEEMKVKLAAAQQELAAARKMAAGETAARMEAEAKLVSAMQELDAAGRATVILRGKLAVEDDLRKSMAAADGERQKAVAELQALSDAYARTETALREKEANFSSRSASDQKVRDLLEKEKLSLKEELAVTVKRAAESDALALRLRERDDTVKELEARREADGARIRSLQDELAGAIEEGERASGERSRSEKERAAARERLEHEKTAAEKEAAALREKLRVLEKEKTEIVSRAAALEGEITAVRRDMEQTKAGLGETEKNALEREEDLRRERAGRKKAEEEVAAGRKAAETAALQCASLERAAAAEKEAAAAARNRAAALQQKVAEEEKKAQDLAESLSAEERKGRELHLEAEKVKAARAQMESAMAETRKKLEETARTRDILEKSLGDARQKLEESVKARELQERGAAGLRKEIEERERARAALEKSLSDEKARHAAAVEQCRKLQADAESLRRSLAATGEKGGKLEAIIRDLEGRGKALAGDLEKERQALAAAEAALKESGKAAERLAGERERREGALKAEVARVAKEKSEIGKRLEEAQTEGRKMAERIKSAEAQYAEAQDGERAAAAALARFRGVLDAALHQAQALVASPAGTKEGLEALVRSLNVTLEKEVQIGKGAGPARTGAGRPGKAGMTAALAAGLLAGAAAGYLVLPGLFDPHTASTAVSETSAEEPSVGGAPIEDSPALIEYAKSWSRLTQEAVQDDLRIQATLHSTAEVELALALIALKEGWSAGRLQQALDEARKMMGSAEVLVATVLVKGGTRAAPSAGELAKRLMVKDPWGKMIPAADLGKDRALGKALLAAARAPNPDYLDAVGVTVAFPRKGLRLEAKTLQLVLAPAGGEPGRMVVWDMTSWGD